MIVSNLIDTGILIGLIILLIGNGFYPIYHTPEKIDASFWKRYQVNRRRNNIEFNHGMENDRRRLTSVSPLYIESEEVGPLFFHHKVGYCITFVLTLSVLLQLIQKGITR